MAQGDTWRIAMTGTLLGQQYVNIFHGQLISGAGDITGLVHALETDLYTPLLASLGDAWSLSLARCTKMAYPEEVFEHALSLVGAISVQEELPPQCSLVVTWRTGYAGRSRRGRTYLAGFTENNAANGEWGTGAVSLWQGYVDDFVAAYGLGGTSADYQFGVWSEKLGHPTLTTYSVANGYRPITAGVVRPIVYNQRRRTIGVGA